MKAADTTYCIMAVMHVGHILSFTPGTANVKFQQRNERGRACQRQKIPACALKKTAEADRRRIAVSNNNRKSTYSLSIRKQVQTALHRINERKGGGTIMGEIKIRNYISIDGQPEVLFDSLPKEKQKEISERLQENAMRAIGFRRKNPKTSV
ncbi:MAG: hypothetical protein HFG49_08470 [Lachnospiraceae bacterium]|nr:hypothetical protein [Lachnospiraceae bacterium]